MTSGLPPRWHVLAWRLLGTRGTRLALRAAYAVQGLARRLRGSRDEPV